MPTLVNYRDVASKSVKITDYGLSKIPGDLNELMTKSGKPAWDSTGGMDGLVIQIATESPSIPETMSEIGKDFLRRCFAWDPTERWTAEMLVHHPFLLETQAPPPSTTTALGFSVSKKLPPPPRPGFESIAKRTSLPKILPPPPPGFSSRRILA